MRNLLAQEADNAVQPTSLSRKITLNGTTQAYPVYRVRLDQLYYNDQNDRIATWISQYKSEHGEQAFELLDRDAYNAIIERFIIESNEAAIERTQTNIALVRQREPGVVLSDGRVIDGNRRFTCLRRLAEKDSEFNWFETVILNTSLESDKKQIKMLELAIQHGEEKKVDYNPIDRLVGVYQDIVETGLLSIDEYAVSTNESVFEVKKRVESAMLLVEFLDYIHLPKQYHVARDYQVVSVISDLQPLLRKCSTVELREQLKNAIFANVMMRTIGDSRKYIRNVSQMMDNGFFAAYIKDQERIGSVLREDLNETAPQSKRDLDLFVSTHEEAAEELQVSLDRSLLKAKKQETRNKPSQIVTKSITLLKDVDTRIFEKLTDDERENLRGQLNRLTTAVERINTVVDGEIEPELQRKREEAKQPLVNKKIVAVAEDKKPEFRYYIGRTHVDEPAIFCLNTERPITTLGVTVSLYAKAINEQQKTTADIRAFFVNEHYEVASDVKQIHLVSGETAQQIFTLTAKATASNVCFLAIQSELDRADELQQLIPFKIKVEFASDFDF